MVLSLYGVSFSYISLPLFSLILVESQNLPVEEILWLTGDGVGLQDGDKLQMSSVSLLCALANHVHPR